MIVHEFLNPKAEARNTPPYNARCTHSLKLKDLWSNTVHMLEKSCQTFLELMLRSGLQVIQLPEDGRRVFFAALSGQNDINISGDAFDEGTPRLFRVIDLHHACTVHQLFTMCLKGIRQLLEETPVPHCSHFCSRHWMWMDVEWLDDRAPVTLTEHVQYYQS